MLILEHSAIIFSFNFYPSIMAKGVLCLNSICPIFNRSFKSILNTPFEPTKLCLRIDLLVTIKNQKCCSTPGLWSVGEHFDGA